MVPYQVLSVSADAAVRQTVRDTLGQMPVELAETASLGEARESIPETQPIIAVVSDTLPESEWFELCEILRMAHRGEPFQIILTVSNLRQDVIERALNGLIDDFHVMADSPESLRLRVQSAIRRINDHDSVAAQREYYRRAARKEEELTSQVLDRALALKDRVESMPDGARIVAATGLLKEAALLEDVDAEVERAVRSLNSLSGFLVSMDNGALFTRTHGVEAMSTMCGQVGRALHRGLRKYDIAGHYRDDSVLVALPGTDLDLGELVAARFRTALARIASRSPGLAESVTFSFGVSVFTGNESREHWLDRARASLVRARSLGGDRIETDETPANAYAAWKATRGG